MCVPALTDADRQEGWRYTDARSIAIAEQVRLNPQFSVELRQRSEASDIGVDDLRPRFSMPALSAQASRQSGLSTRCSVNARILSKIARVAP